MSKLAQKRRKWGYQANVPRCSTCVEFVKASYFLIDSLPRHFGPKCKAGGFAIQPTGCCDRWTNKEGETVEA